MTDEEMITSFLNCMRPHRVETTLKKYRRILENFKDECSGGFKNAVKEIIITFICRPELSKRTWVQHFATLKHFYNWMHDRDMILINPFDKLQYPKLEKLLPKNVMTGKETEKLLSMIPADPLNSMAYRDRTILELMYSCSLRRSEVVGLNVTDFSLDSRSLRVKAGKTGRGRISPVGRYVCELLSEYIELHRPNKENKAVFQNTYGNRLSADYITRRVRELREKSNIRTKASSHSFRKSSATHMLKNGAPLVSVQALLGHSVISSTEAYTKVYPKDLFRIHKAHHPREKQKNQVLPELCVPSLLFRRK
ncbi:MAG: tyrosine-type recombinase/integrase [Planctomycetes bacterium]|nr:tyrosine-type recombinase/integrase [Planctomycetota bacterium]